MESLTLKILKSDIDTTFYTDGWNCAITRALHRAGFPDWYDCGTYIKDKNGNKIVTWNNSDYDKLCSTVIKMYQGSEPAVDFEITINY